jgi:hypothetical protein
MSEAQQQAAQHPSKAQFDKLVAYVQELVADHNRLEARVNDLESVLLGNGRKTGSAVDTRFRGRKAALEAEAGS